MSVLKILWARRGSKRQEKENKSHKVLSNAFSDRQLQEKSWGTTCGPLRGIFCFEFPELKKAFFQKEVIFGNTMLAHLDWGRSNSFWGRSISTTCWLYSRLVRITPNCITGEGRTWINWWGMSTIRKIAHLIRQVNWIIRIGSKCPYLALTRWLSMGSFCDWVHDYRLQIIQQYLESSHESEPDDRWWLTTTAVKIITSPINHYDSLVHFHTLPQWSPIFQLLNMWPTTPEVDLKTTL